MKTIIVIFAIFCVCSCTLLNTDLTVLDFSSIPINEDIPLVCNRTTSTQTADCSSDENLMSIILYTKDKPYGVSISNNNNLSQQLLNTPNQIIFLVHGFYGSGNMSLNYQLANAIITNCTKNYTVLSLDWSVAACSNYSLQLLNSIPLDNTNIPTKYLAYARAVNNVRSAADFLNKTIIYLNKTCNVPLSNITLIGHSLGAHVCGLAAKNIRNVTGLNLTLIIGADPAGPCFQNIPCEDRLCCTDAYTVIVIHTSSKYGMIQPCGSFDLYFNGGFIQPGCVGNETCNHFKVLVYLIRACSSSFQGSLNVIVPAVSSCSSNTSNTSNILPANNNCFVMNCTIFDSNYVKNFDKFKGYQYCMAPNEPYEPGVNIICPNCNGII